ncbi:WD40-repeat-containing domain protein [Podospora appendiculata]|uniref:WD40-repeat-containing domain protein n=1 Tax=Podospora appendiculata TaxID=314037 RepID=A0AAE1CHI7_9PEZI|nr:WD40-repeat-containing domain protein [Podospora appendiculata]
MVSKSPHVNGEAAALKKRKREPKDDAPLSLKKLRSKPKPKQQRANADESPVSADNPAVDTADGVVEVPAASASASDPSSSLQPSPEAGRDAPAPWKVSNPMGGRMLDLDPIFSPDEAHLIITYNTSLQIYSTADSLLVRRIPLPVSRPESGIELASAHIVSTVLSRGSPEYVWVACSDGRIWHINWITGAGADTPFTIEAKKVLDMTVESVEFAHATEDVLLVLQKLTKASGQIVAYDTNALSTKNGKLLHTYDDSPQLLRSSASGRLIVAAAKEAIHIGLLKTKSKPLERLGDLEYRFHSFGATDIITCLDIRTTLRTTNKGGSEIQSVDLVVGCARGAIYLYDDILAKLPSGSSISKASPIQPRKYHWHRRAVHSVKWSEDGNYLISGGYETVLVLWQLDTGKRDYLPHLSAAIENIVVSPRGSSYAVHLDDNSTMVLSTAEMKPTTYVSGIQSLVLGDRPSKESLVRRVWKTVDEISTPLVTASSPLHPSQIFLSVGNGQQATLGGGGPSTPLLQAFDMSSFQGVAKHAIARTNPTDANITSQGLPIIEPRVTKLAFSQDGKWLASVDEWQPPDRGVEPFLTGSKTPGDVCQERREIYLKFWEVGGEENSLELVTRINEAHYTTQPETIFDLASDPTSPRFATLGNDGIVRFWTSRLRRRDGIATTGPEGQQLRSWACSRTVSLPAYGQQDDTAEHSTQMPRSGALTFSEDGSILFAAFGAASEAVVVAIDTATGSFRDVVSGMFKGEVRGIKALSSCLIMLSDEVTVYDIVSDELQYSFGLKETSQAAKRLTQLAVNYESRSFALVAPVPNPSQEKMRRGAKSELVVFSIDDPEPRLVQTFPQVITAVFPATGSTGFVVVDSAAQIWSVTEGAEQAPLLQPLADLGMAGGEESAPQDLVQDDGEASDEEMQDMDVDMDVDMDDDYEIHQAVIAPQRLAEIFNTAPAFAMPPIEDIFYQVAGLFSTKPLKA